MSSSTYPSNQSENTANSSPVNKDESSESEPSTGDGRVTRVISPMSRSSDESDEEFFECEDETTSGTGEAASTSKEGRREDDGNELKP